MRPGGRGYHAWAPYSVPPWTVRPPGLPGQTRRGGRGQGAVPRCARYQARRPWSVVRSARSVAPAARPGGGFPRSTDRALAARVCVCVDLAARVCVVDHKPRRATWWRLVRDPLTWDQADQGPGTRPTRDQARDPPTWCSCPRYPVRDQVAMARATWCAVPGARPGFPGARPGARPTRHQGRRPGAGGQASRALQRK
jgi:hypothetical protein